MRKYCRRLAGIFAVMLLFISAVSVSAAASEEGAPGYLVDFTTQEGVADWEALAKESDGPVHGMANKVKWEFNTEEGFLRFTPRRPVAETAESGDTRMTAEMDFNPSEYPFLAFCYRINGRVSQNHIYLKDDTGNTEYSGKEHTWLYPSFQEDEEWHVMVLDIRSSFSGIEGNVQGVRIPVTDTKDSSFDIKYIGAFQTVKDAENFNIDQYLAGDGVQETPAPTPAEEAANPVGTNAPAEGSAASFNWVIAVVAATVAVAVVAAVVVVLVLTKKK